MRTVDLLRQLADDLCTRGVGEALELLEMFVDVVPSGRSLAWRSDEDDAFDRRREGDWFSANW